MKLDADIEWGVERVLVSERYKVSRAELETAWSFEDLQTATRVLDALEDAEMEAVARAKASAPQPRR